MVKISSILAAAAAATLILTTSANAVTNDFPVLGGDSNAARHYRFLRVVVATSSSNVSSLIDGSLDNSDEEDALHGKGSLAGHTSPSDADQDSKSPCNHDGHNNPKDAKLENNNKSGKLNSTTNKTTVVSSSPPLQNHDVRKDGKHSRKGDGKKTSKSSSDHATDNPSDVGYVGKPHVDSSSKDAAHPCHGDGSFSAHAPPSSKGAVHNKLKKVSSFSAGSADAYLNQ
ncbi:hypothetical protein F444_20058 [Phytophthora nicotianae P1976]|uniref:RxLR effector protein n=1 Tax=Phytophthora nicotianae P1976 TaxID=1317066 RepID=A0A080Z5U0_PHYNI|nr:hypothetical protein F444_20058 [Phytophthora nicotianae P1976]